MPYDLSNIVDAAEKTFEPAGHCIYCGRTDGLSDEHIVAYGLGGTIVLPRTSCPQCRKITGRFEHMVLRGPMWDVRALRGFPSRRPGDYPR